ncbi:MAG: phage minor capsid protein [Coriobacteriia bacterium]
MLTPEQIDELATGIVSGYQEEMIARLFQRLIRALVSDRMLTVREIELLDRAASTNRETLEQTVAMYEKQIREETKATVRRALLASDAGDVEILSTLYPGAAGVGSTAAYARVAQETAEGVALIIGRDNIKLASHAADLWYDVSAEAIVRFNHASSSPDDIIRDAIGRLYREGLSVIDYRSGVRTPADAAVRRHIVTQVGQASGRMTERRMLEYGHDLVQTTAHFGARPDHAVWQGRVFSLSGSGGYPDFYAATSYGTVTGLQGANCRHGWGPWYPGMATSAELPELNELKMTNDDYYEATQKQRRRERLIRQKKAEIHGLEVAGIDADSPAMVQARLELGAQQRRLKAYTDKTGLPRMADREKAYGIGVQPRGLRKAG